MLFLLLLATAITTTAVIVRDYNKVNFIELKNFEEFKNKFIDNNNNNNELKVNTNLVLGVARPECYHLLESPALRGAQRHSGGNVLVSAILPASEFPYNVFNNNEDYNDNNGHNCAVAIYYNKGALVEHPQSTIQDFTHSVLNPWLAEQVRIKDMLIINNFNYPIHVYWHEESNDPVFQGTLQPGQSFTSSTFLGHIFSASAVNDNDISDIPGTKESNDAAAASVVEGAVHPAYFNIIDFFVVDSNTYSFNPNNRLQTCELDSELSNNADELLALGAEHGLHCGNMFLRLVEFTHKVWYEKRLGLNYVQPQFVEPVTDTGFEHRKLPKETYQWLREWYLREQLQQEIIESSSGPCMNQHVAPSGVTHLTRDYKDRLSAELKDILEGWHGAPLELTSIYGVRRYNNGSVLRMHVDTVNTHVVSAIINVDQAVEKDWPLLILDHEDNEHYLVMQPGDMVLYESAKLLHGRPDPFIGSHYDNIFIHYKPVAGWNYDWL